MTELQFLEANGVRLAYYSEGEGPLVVLTHGFPDTAHTWDGIRPAIARAGFRAVTPFLRGYAPSAAAPDGKYDSDTLGRDVLALAAALSDEPATLIGHDFGASASYAAAAFGGPERVRQLVTLAIPHPAVVKPSLGLLWRARHFIAFKMPGAVGRLRANDFAQVDELVKRWSPQWSFSAEDTRTAKECFAQPGSAEAAIDFYKQLSPKLPEGHRKKIDVPTVSFAGETDGALLDLTLYEKARSRFTSDYEVVTLPGGHFLHLEHPEQFEQELMQRLR